MKIAETDRPKLNPWMTSEQSSRFEINGHDLFIKEPVITDRNESQFGAPQVQHNSNTSNSNLGIGERVFSSAGAAFLSAVIVNPLDVVKVRIISTILCRFPYCLLFECSLCDLSIVSLLFKCGLKTFLCLFMQLTDKVASSSCGSALFTSFK